MNFTRDLGAGVFCKNAILLDSSISTFGNIITLSYLVYGLASNNYNRKIQISLYFTLNATTATYDMAAPYIYSLTQSFMFESIARARKYK